MDELSIEFKKEKVYTGTRKSNDTAIGTMATGQLVMNGVAYAAISGPWSAGVLPNGAYGVKKYNVVDKGLQAGFICQSGKQFFIPLQQPSNIKRSGFGIHPDGNIEGTQGCIGIVGADADKFWKAWMNLPLSKRPSKIRITGITDVGTAKYEINNTGGKDSSE